jgi:hypothetical protein
MSSESWPPPLKEWVARCLGQMTDANRAEAQAELRESIANAFAEKTLWTTDWAGVQLKRCGLSSLQAELQISVTCNIQPDAQSSPGAQLPETQNG